MVPWLKTGNLDVTGNRHDYSRNPRGGVGGGGGGGNSNIGGGEGGSSQTIVPRSSFNYPSASTGARSTLSAYDISTMVGGDLPSAPHKTDQSGDFDNLCSPLSAPVYLKTSPPAPPTEAHSRPTTAGLYYDMTRGSHLNPSIGEPWSNRPLALPRLPKSPSRLLAAFPTTRKSGLLEPHATSPTSLSQSLPSNNEPGIEVV